MQRFTAGIIIQKSVEESALSEFFQTTSETIFESKGWTLLAILFGYGFSVLLKNISRHGQNHYHFFDKTHAVAFWPLPWGTRFFWSDILNDYALMGLILLLFYNLSTN